MDIHFNTSTITTRQHTVRLSDDDLVELLRQELKAQGVKFLPEGKIEVFVSVPGGGDYSSTDLEIDEGTPLTIRWMSKDND